MNSSRIFPLAGLLAGLFLAAGAETPAERAYRAVDPFIGTGGDGHTYPGATVPFGMIQLGQAEVSSIMLPSLSVSSVQLSRIVPPAS